MAVGIRITPAKVFDVGAALVECVGAVGEAVVVAGNAALTAELRAGGKDVTTFAIEFDAFGTAEDACVMTAAIVFAAV